MQKNQLKLREGFTLIELLVVMAVIAILTGFALANVSNFTHTATRLSMKNDVRNAIATEATSMSSYGDYDTVNTAAAANANGRVVGDINKEGFGVSKGNLIQVTLSNCADGSTGFKVKVSNPKIKGFNVYDSCVDSSIQFTKTTK